MCVTHLFGWFQVPLLLCSVYPVLQIRIEGKKEGRKDGRQRSTLSPSNKPWDPNDFYIVPRAKVDRTEDQGKKKEGLKAFASNERNDAICYDNDDDSKKEEFSHGFRGNLVST